MNEINKGARLTQTDTFTALPPESSDRVLMFAFAADGAELVSASVNGVAATLDRCAAIGATNLYSVRVHLPVAKNAVVESVWTPLRDDPTVMATILWYQKPTKH